MRQTVFGAVTGACLVYAAVVVGSGGGSTASAQRPTFSPDPSNGLIALPSTLADGRQMLTIVDPRNRAVGYYQLDPSRGEIVLKGVRNITWDLQIDEYNGASPLPSEVRSLLEQR